MGYDDVKGSKIAIYEKDRNFSGQKMPKSAKISPEEQIKERKMAENHYVGAPKNFVKWQIMTPLLISRL